MTIDKKQLPIQNVPDPTIQVDEKQELVRGISEALKDAGYFHDRKILSGGDLMLSCSSKPYYFTIVHFITTDDMFTLRLPRTPTKVFQGTADEVIDWLESELSTFYTY